MSGAARKRRERQRTSPAIQASRAPATEPPALPPLPEWKWRTLPVFFALTGGLFLGCWIGVLVGLSNASGLAFWIPLAFALPFSFALSRLTTRLMVERRWIKPKPAR